MTRGFGGLAREYEAKRYPPTRRLDVHGEGPRAARDRALRWIQSFAHEEPGAELLLIVERGHAPHRPATAVRREVEEMLRDLEGRLIDWWQEFHEGSLALRVSDDPRMRRFEPPPPPDPHEGRTPDTAGPAMPPPELDIPPELLPVVQRTAELRREREGLSLGLAEVVLRQVWIEAQADAMSREIGFDAAVEALLASEQARVLDEEG